MMVYSLLYVDDEPDLLEIGRIFLEESGEFSVRTVGSAAAALNLLEERTFDAIVSDYQMPEINGIGLLKSVRSRHGDLPFILFTGRGREEVVIEAINCGVDFYVQKGGDIRVQFADLAHLIKKAIERRQVVDALAGNREYLNRIISSVREGILIVDAVTHQIVDLNPAAVRMIKTTRDEILNRPCHRYLCTRIGDHCPVTDRHRPIEHAEDTLLTARDEQVPIVRNVVPFWHQGRACLLETIADDTERKRADENLHAAYEQVAAAKRELLQQNETLRTSIELVRVSEERFRELADLLPVPIVETTPGGALVFTNRALRRVFGYTSAECRQTVSLLDLVADEKREHAGEVFTRILAGEQEREGMECTLRRRDGSTFPAIIHANRILDRSDGACTGLRGVALDISKRKQVELRLLESEEKFRSLVEQSLEGIIIIDFEGTLLYANPQFGVIIEDDRYEEMIGRCNVLEFLDERCRDEATRNLAQVAAGIDRYLVSFKTYTRRLRERWIECFGKRLQFEGTPAILLCVRDITERRMNEAALRESEELHTKLIATIPDIVVQTGLDGTIVAINDSVVAIGGYAGAEDLVGRNMFGFFAPDDLPRVTENARLMFERKLGPVEYLFQKKDGSHVLLEVNGDVLRDPAGQPYGMVFICRDLTARREAETALSRANQRLRHLSATTGQELETRMTLLAGDLARLVEAAAGTPLAGDLETILTAADRIAATIRSVRMDGENEPAISAKKPDP